MGQFNVHDCVRRVENPILPYPTEPPNDLFDFLRHHWLTDLCNRLRDVFLGVLDGSLDSFLMLYILHQRRLASVPEKRRGRGVHGIL